MCCNNTHLAINTSILTENTIFVNLLYMIKILLHTNRIKSYIQHFILVFFRRNITDFIEDSEHKTTRYFDTFNLGPP